MNKKETYLQRKKVSNQYHTPQSTWERKWNSIHFSTSNSEEHEIMKARVCYDLLKKGHKFITEAVDCESDKRRDVVDLDTGEIYEIETTEERAERHSKDINVVMVESP